MVFRSADAPGRLVSILLLLPAFLLGLFAAPAGASDLYLHGTGAADNPSVLFLDSVSPAGTTDKYRDSASVNFANGNPWKEIGTWPQAAAAGVQTITSLGAANVWVGLKNSDDQGTQFDLQADLYKNATLIASGATLCVTGITRNPDLAKQVSIAFGSISNGAMAAGDVLSLRILTRIGTNPDGTKCSGPGGSHSNAVGLRLYFDAASRASSFAVSIATDTTPPTITASLSPAPNANGWNKTDVVVSFTCSDAQSGVVSCPSPVTVTSEGANQQITRTATDGAGNTASLTVMLNIDKSNPSITATKSPAANANGWNNTDVTITFTCSDALSGIASCPPAASITREGAAQTVSGTATDQAGNSATANATVNVDKTPPVLTTTAPADGAVTSNATLSVTGSVSDALSGVSTVVCNSSTAATISGTTFSCTVTLVEGANTVTVLAQDRAGNPVTASVSVTLSTSIPTITGTPAPTPNANGWNNTNVVVTFTCSDPATSITSCTSPITVSTEGANQTVTGTAVNNVGTSATTTVVLNIDKTAPLIAATPSPAPNAGGWNNANVTVGFTCSDALSGIASCPASSVVSTEGSAQSVSGTATDRAGNSATATATVKLDKTAPRLTIASPANNATVATSPATVTGTSSDALSGLSSVSCNTVTATISAGNFTCNVPLASGANTITVQATDIAGNLTTSSIIVNLVTYVPQPTGPIPVTWINPVNVAINGNSLTKSANTQAWDAGAASKQVIRDGYGFVEFTVSETNKDRLVGLSSKSSGTDPSVIDYEIYLRPDSTVNINENGHGITSPIPMHSGDRFRVEVRYGVVRYLQNGTVFYTSTAIPAFPLRAMTTIFSPGGTVTDVRLGNFVWTDAAGAVVSGESLRKTAVDGWNSGAISTKTIESGDGYFEFTSTETNTTRAAGFTNNKTGQTTADIAFGFLLNSNGSLEIVEGGTSLGTFGLYLSGDRLRVEEVSGIVRYYRNGLQLYTSTVTPAYPLRADAVLFTFGATFTDADIESLSCANTTGVTIQDALITKTTADGWNAGGSSTNTIASGPSGEGWMEFTALETNTRRAAGLKSDGPAQSYADIDFAIDLGATGLISVYELGALRGQFGSYANGDRLRVEIQDGIVRYRKNGIVFYTSAVTPTYPLHSEVSLFSLGATLFDVAMDDLVWINDANVRIFGNSLAKTGTTQAFDSGAYSTKRINSGYMEFTATETSTDRIAGLTHGIKSQDWRDVDFGIYFDPSAHARVYENGTLRGIFDVFVPGDRFRVEVANNVVKYRKNGVVFYTSTVAPNLPLRVDADMFQPRAMLLNMILVGDSVIEPLPAPSISPGTNNYTNTVSVTITDSVPLATIRYTLDGTDPVDTSTVYSGTLTINQTTTLKAKAFKSNYSPSPITTAVYTLKVATPSFTPAAGTYNTAQNVAISTAVAGTTIFYTLDGSNPTAASPVYSSPITVDQSMTLKAKATKAGWTDSDIATASYTLKVGALTLTPAPGNYNGVQNVAVTTATPNVTVRYTLDGTVPTSASPAAANNTIVVDHSTALRVQAFRTGFTPSDVVSGNYFLNLGTAATPLFTPSAGTFTTAQNVTIASSTPGATIRYTTDGTEPAIGSRVYSGPIVVFATTDLRAKAFRSDMTMSATAAGLFVINTGNVDTPRLSPGSGTYSTYQTVTITTQTAGATIHYTTNGTDPTESDPVIASGSTVAVNQSMTLKARAFVTGSNSSDIARGAYFITGAIAMSDGFAVAVKPDGTLWSWGNNNDAQLGREPRNTVSPTPAQMTISDVIAVATGTAHGLALKRDGTVWAWGDGAFGRLCNGSGAVQWAPVPVTALTDIIAISAGGYHSVLVKRDGTVWMCGLDSDTNVSYGSVPVRKDGLTGITQVASNGNSTFALKTDGEQSGTLWAWGGNFFCNLGDGTCSNQVNPVPVVGLTGVTVVAAGNSHTMAGKSDGTVWTWGNNCCGQLGTLDTNGRAVPGIAALPDEGKVLSVAAGSAFSLVVERPQGAASATWAWGGNGSCRFGNGTSNPSIVPVLNLVADAVAVAAGGASGLAISTDGRIWAWGDNSFGQLGDGTTTTRCSPFPIPGFGGTASPLNDDPDGDGVPTWLELLMGTDPWNPDTNGDGIPDGARANGISPTNLDIDGDGLTNAQELAMGTDPFRADTDGDGVNDKLDCFPLDPSRTQCPAPVPGDTTPPTIILKEPTNATLVGSVP